MFNNKKSDSTVDDVTFISAGIIFEGGVLSGTGSVRIDGTVTAKIDMHGELVIGETGVVTGDVFTESALVSGKIIGNVTCSAVLHLTSTAKIEGNLLVSAIVVDEGAKIEGSCRTQKTSAQEAAARIVEIPGYEPKNQKKREAKETQEASPEQA